MTQSPKYSMYWRLWRRSISVKRPQAVLALGSLLVGAAVTSALLNLYGDVRRKMSQEFRAYGPNVVVAPAPEKTESGDVASLEPASFAGVMSEDVLRRLDSYRSATPGLLAVPVLYVVTRVERVPSNPRLPEAQNAVTVGADFAGLRRLYPGWRVEGGDGKLDEGNCLIGARLASRLRLASRDTVKIGMAGTTAKKAQPERQTYRIAGLLSTGASEDDEVLIPLASLQKLAGFQGKISVVQLSVPGDASDVEAKVREISRAFPEVEVSPIHQIVYSEGHVLGMIRWLLFLLTALILIIMALCVGATMTAIVLERRKDIAVMKALGASDNLVMQLFLTEGATLGLTGGMAGFILGGFLACHLAHRLFGVTLNLVWWSFPTVCLSMMLLALAATVFPVRIVRAVQPAAVLKGE